MAVLTLPHRSIRPALVILRIEIVALTLATAWIHATLAATWRLRPRWSCPARWPASAGSPDTR